MNKFLTSISLLCLLSLGFNGCKDDESSTTAPDNTNKTLTIKTVFDLEPNLADGWLYYSFDTESIIPASQAETDLWDIKFRALDFDPDKPETYKVLINTYISKGFIFLNSGTVNVNGKTLGIVMDSSYTQLTTAPADANFKQDDTTYAGVTSKSIITNQFLVYSGAPNHAVSQKSSNVLVLKTKSGIYVKMQLLSMYKGHPETPTTKDDVGFYSIAYTKGNGRRLK